jgi:hypothetical protein
VIPRRAQPPHHRFADPGGSADHDHPPNHLPPKSTNPP